MKLMGKLLLSAMVGAITTLGVGMGVGNSQPLGRTSKPELRKVSSSTPLYLEHAKNFQMQDSNTYQTLGHTSHASHSSHYSHSNHGSHASHASHSSGSIVVG